MHTDFSEARKWALFRILDSHLHDRPKWGAQLYQSHGQHPAANLPTFKGLFYVQSTMHYGHSAGQVKPKYSKLVCTQLL